MTARSLPFAAFMAALLAGIAIVVVATVHSGGEEDTPRAAAERFLDRYMDRDGRVVRRDQGGDTVSEGQAYAMLLAAAIGDERRFDAAWRWTRSHLQGDSGVLAWRWSGGQVTDYEPAPDGDLDAARALLVAAHRFGRPELAAAGRALGRAVERQMATGDVLLAGRWARAGRVVNPSYFSPRTFAALDWDGAESSARRLLRALPEPLPPDWARLAGDGVAVPTGRPADPGEPPAYGYDAARMPVRYAESCAPADRALAARAWPALRARDPLPARLTLDGAAAGGETEHPAALAGAAGAARAAGDDRAARALLDRAAALDRSHPTYYGGAWTALGRVMLETNWLGRC